MGMLGIVTTSLNFPLDSLGRNLKYLNWLYLILESPSLHSTLSLTQSSLENGSFVERQQSKNPQNATVQMWKITRKTLQHCERRQ